MKTFTINTVKDVEEFFTWLSDEMSIWFHPDDAFESYVWRDSGERCFSEKEAAYYDLIMDECFHVCDNEGVDIYEIGLNILKNKSKNFNNMTL